MAMNMPGKPEKNKALDVMIAIGARKGMGVKEEGGSYKEPTDSSADNAEDTAEGETETCSKCDAPMVCKGCDMPESECSC